MNDEMIGFIEYQYTFLPVLIVCIVVGLIIYLLLRKYKLKVDKNGV